MGKSDITWRLFGVYILLLFLMIWAGTAKAQMQLVVFNASWNDGNDVIWVQKLSDCETIGYYDIGKDKEMQKKHKIAVVPTIIIFKDGEEVARFQADLSFKMLATKEDIQEEIDNQLMSDF